MAVLTASQLTSCPRQRWVSQPSVHHNRISGGCQADGAEKMERGWVCDCVPVLTYQLAQPQGFCFRRSLGRPRVSFSTSFQVPESAGLGTALGELLVQGTVISHLGYCPSLLAGLEMATSPTWSLSSHPILLPHPAELAHGSGLSPGPRRNRCSVLSTLLAQSSLVQVRTQAFCGLLSGWLPSSI